jgi:glutamate carboxypeptidase
VKLSDLERRVCDLIASRAEELYANLERAVAIPTGRGHAPGLQEYRRILMGRLRGLDALVQVREGADRPRWLALPAEEEGEPARVPQPTVVARHEGAADLPRVLIVGHIDTVHDPHGPFQTLERCDDGARATGPGAVDMKGGIECAFAALESLRENQIECNWTFLLNADEEIGSFESEAVLREEAAKHDYGIVLEPALPGGALATQRMGSGQFKIEVHGRAAHVGRDFAEGVSAVNELARIIVRLSELSDPKRGMIVNVGPLQGGGATNIVADHAACWGNVRFRDEAAARTLAMQIDALASPGKGELPRIIINRHWNRPAKPLTPEVERFAHFARVCAEALGQPLPFASTGGVCDGNILQAMGLPTLDTLGIRGGNLHRTDEFIEIPALVDRAQLLAVMMMQLRGSSIAKERSSR